MAVTSSFVRNHSNFTSSTFRSYNTATLSGTYVTGGFTWNPYIVPGSKGASPLPMLGAGMLEARFISPLGYIYVTTFSGTTATTKIFTAANNELGNGVAVPDASLTVVLEGQKGV